MSDVHHPLNTDTLRFKSLGIMFESTGRVTLSVRAEYKYKDEWWDMWYNAGGGEWWIRMDTLKELHLERDGKKDEIELIRKKMREALSFALSHIDATAGLERLHPEHP